MILFYKAFKNTLIPCLGLIFILASCAKDDTKEKALRLKSLTITEEYTMPAHTNHSVINYYYNDKNQQVGISLDGIEDSIIISYGNDGRISDLVFIVSDFKRGKLYAEWNGSQMTLHNEPHNDIKFVYYFNDEDLLEKVEGYFLDNNEWILSRHDEYQWDNGNPVYYESYMLSSKSNTSIKSFEKPYNNILWELYGNSGKEYKNRLRGATLKKVFSSRIMFDGKNSPYYDSPVYRILIFEAGALFSRNNPVHEVTELYNSAGIPHITHTYDYIYEYNSFNLPVKRTTNLKENVTQTASYSYE